MKTLRNSMREDLGTPPLDDDVTFANFRRKTKFINYWLVRGLSSAPVQAQLLPNEPVRAEGGNTSNKAAS